MGENMGLFKSKEKKEFDEETLGKLFANIDGSKDKKLTRKELADFVKTKEVKEKILGKITEDEHAELVTGIMYLSHGDLDNDGSLSFEEFEEELNKHEKTKSILLKLFQ